MALRGTLVAALGCHAALPGVLADAAKAARKAGHLHHGLVAIQKLNAAAQQAPSGAAGYAAGRSSTVLVLLV